MTAPLRLGIIVPAYNEETRLPAGLLGLLAAVSADPRLALAELIVAENGSSDDTAGAAARIGALTGAPVRVLRCRGRGKAAAVVEAGADLLERRPELDWLLVADADGATDPRALAAVDFSVSALWSAQRIGPGAEIVRPAGAAPLRELMSAVMRGLTRALFRLPVADTQCGFKLLPAPAAALLLPAVASRSWVFDVELLARARHAGLPLRGMPARWTDVPGSTVRPLRDAFGSLAALAEIRLRLWRAGIR
jgi:glycosyltransferase involved in cell wall biosynthesis